MSNRDSNSMGLGILLVLFSIALLRNPNCTCGCRTVAEHLLKVGFGFLSGQPG